MYAKDPMNQLYLSSTRIYFLMKPITSMAVSYTHLDVYKRQGANCSNMNNRASTRCFLLPDCPCVSVRRKSSVLKCCYNTIAQKGRSFPISNWWLGLSCRTRCSGEALLNPRVRSVLTFRRVFHRRSDGFQWEKGLRVWSVVPFRDQCRGWILSLIHI